jgi:hypothetical protein
MTIILWVAVPIAAVILFALVHPRRQDEFTEVRRRQRAMDTINGWNLTPHHREKD